MTLPNVVVAGFPRCGTSALFDWFTRYPGAATSSTKETRFFMDPDYPLFDPERNYQDQGLVGYETYFSDVTGDRPLVVEATPDYAYQTTALQHIPDLPTHPHVVFLVRDPIERIVSFFMFARDRVGTVSASVDLPTYVNALVSDPQPEWLTDRPLLKVAIEQSCYDRWLEGWEQAVGRSRLHVVQFERLTRSPPATLTRLLEPMATSLPPPAETSFHVVNASSTPRWPTAARIVSDLRRVMPAPVRGSSLIGEVTKTVARTYRRFTDDRSELSASDRDTLRGVLGDSAERMVSLWGIDPTLWETTLGAGEGLRSEPANGS